MSGQALYILVFKSEPLIKVGLNDASRRVSCSENKPTEFI
jgi:hypothetical protein